MSRMDVVILGRIGYDLYSEEPHVPLPQVRRFSRYLGGSSANMAVGLSRLGAHVGMVSCLGDDSLSRFLIDFLENEKVETSHVQTAPGYLPSLAITEVSPPDRFPQVFYRRDPVDTMLDATLSVRDGELVLIPEGYHPVVAAHGYNVYYLNALAGSARSMAASDDPDYAWVRGAWREQDPRLPMVPPQKQ